MDKFVWNQQLLQAMKTLLLKLLLWSIFLVVSALIAGLPDKIPGLLLGIATGVIYFMLMAFRVQKSASLPVKEAVLSMRVGWGLRLTFIIVMLIVSLTLSGVDFLAAVVGLFSLHIIMLFSTVPLLLRHWLKNR